MGGLGGAFELVVEGRLFVDIVANGLNLSPSRRVEAEILPCEITHLV